LLPVMMGIQIVSHTPLATLLYDVTVRHRLTLES
jgi:hypothetical protein